jgi:hypothetical protein
MGTTEKRYQHFDRRRESTIVARPGRETFLEECELAVIRSFCKKVSKKILR